MSNVRSIIARASRDAKRIAGAERVEIVGALTRLARLAPDQSPSDDDREVVASLLIPGGWPQHMAKLPIPGRPESPDGDVLDRLTEDDVEALISTIREHDQNVAIVAAAQAAADATKQPAELEARIDALEAELAPKVRELLAPKVEAEREFRESLQRRRHARQVSQYAATTRARAMWLFADEEHSG